MHETQTSLNMYIVQRTALANKEPTKFLLNMQEYLRVTTATHTEKSNVTYLQVMDAVADNKDTLIHLLSDLQEQLISNGTHEYIVLEGDAKLYEVLQSLKFEYGECFQWLIPFPGDWHMLMNYQPAIMKAYFDAGLKELAKVAGYPVAAINPLNADGTNMRTRTPYLNADGTYLRSVRYVRMLIAIEEAPNYYLQQAHPYLPCSSCSKRFRSCHIVLSARGLRSWYEKP